MTIFQFPQTPKNLPSLNLKLQTGQEKLIEKLNGNWLSTVGLIDTGFDGFLSVPKSYFKNYPLQILDTQEVYLANGKKEAMEITSLKIMVQNCPELTFEAETYLSQDDQTLIGMQFIEAVCESFDVEFVIDIIGCKVKFNSIF